jgi:hypothetical protein
MITDTEGEVQIKGAAASRTIPRSSGASRRCRASKAATPYASDMVMIKFQDKPAFPLLRAWTWTASGG